MQSNESNDAQTELVNTLMMELINKLKMAKGIIDDSVISLVNKIYEVVDKDEIYTIVSEHACVSPFSCLEDIIITTELLEFLHKNFSYLINVRDNERIPPLTLICKNKTVQLQHIKFMVEHGADMNLFNYEDEPDTYPIPMLCSENELISEKFDILQYLISIDSEESCQLMLFYLCGNTNYPFDNVEEIKHIISISDDSLVFESDYFGHDIFSIMLQHNKYKCQEIVDLLKSYHKQNHDYIDEFLIRELCYNFWCDCADENEDEDNIYDYINVLKSFDNEYMINSLIEYIGESNLLEKENIIYHFTLIENHTKSAAKLR